MHCDTSELLFEDLLEGTLAPRRRRELDAHLEECARCRSVLEELRVVDALLLTPRRLEPAPNFTFKTMAEIRSLPAPRVRRTSWPWMLALYLSVSWLAIGTWLSVGRPDAWAIFGFAWGALQHVGGALDGIARVAADGFGFGFAGVVAVVGTLLAIDVMLLGGVLFVRSVVRPRIVAHLARSETR